MGAGRADLVPERIDPELRAALKERAKTDNMTRRKVIRTQHKRTSRSATLALGSKSIALVAGNKAIL